MYKYKTIWCPFTQKYLFILSSVIKETNVLMLITFKIIEEIPNNMNMSQLDVNFGTFLTK